MKLPATYIQRAIDKDMHFELLKLAGYAMKGYHKAKNTKREINTKHEKKKY